MDELTCWRSQCDRPSAAMLLRWLAAVAIAFGVIAAPALATPAATQPVFVSADSRDPVMAPLIAVDSGFEYILTQPPSRIRPSMFEWTRTRQALVGEFSTSEGRFSGDFGDIETARAESSQLLGLLVALAALFVAFFSGSMFLVMAEEEGKERLVVGGAYVASASFLLYRILDHFELHLLGGYSAAGSGWLLGWVDMLSPLVLVFIGLLLSYQAVGTKSRAWRAWSALLGVLSIGGATTALVVDWLRDEVTIIVDNATGTPYRVAVDGLSLGTLPAQTHASVTLCGGGLLHSRPGSVVIALQAPQRPALQPIRVNLHTAPASRLILNVENRNIYRIVVAEYRR